MKLSRKWLNEFVDLSIEECNDRAFAEGMTPGQEEEYLTASEYLTFNTAYDTFALTAKV